VLCCVAAAEEAGDVAAYLVPRIREVPPKSSTLTGGIASQYIQYLTKPKAYGQIISVSACSGWHGLTSLLSKHMAI
jgi:hypothetical protein